MDITYTMQREMLRRGYSNRTVHSYTHCIKSFMKFYKKDLKYTSKLDIKNFLDFHIDKGHAGNTLNVNLNALKFLFEEILNKKLTLKIRYSKVPKTVPVFLTKEEVKKLFEVTKNEKHKLILEILYSAGLRVSEVTNLKVSDLEFDRDMGWIRKGKGNKDRPFIIANLLKNKLISFINNNKLHFDSYLFSGNNNPKYSIRSIQEIVKKSAKLAKITKNIHPHSLRHSYATHLIENGYDVSSVQSLLGHNSAETTMIYVHMANPQLIKIKSPYDNL